MRFGPVDIDFDATVLEPRPWTIAQSEWAAEFGPVVMAELGCGAGHIGLAAAALSGGQMVQVDDAEAACRWAAHNTARAALSDRVTQRCGAFDVVLRPDDRFDVVVADPPYVPSSELGRYPDDPHSAIDGGPDGLDDVRLFVSAAARHLSEAGSVILQVRGDGQVDQVQGWLQEPSAPRLAVVDVRLYGADRALVRLMPAPSQGP